MKCDHPDCTGVHDNNRYHELCPRSLDGKRVRGSKYSVNRWANDPEYRFRSNLHHEIIKYRKRLAA